MSLSTLTFRMLLQNAGLPMPVQEHRFHPVRRFRFDYAWLAEKVALEVDGGIWTRGRHSRGSGQIRDMEKRNLAVRMGWRVVNVTPQQLQTKETLEMLTVLLKGTPHVG